MYLCLSVCLDHVNMSVCLSVRPRATLSRDCLFIYLLACLSVRLSAFLSVCLAVFPLVCLLSVRLPVCLVFPSVCLSVSLPTCLYGFFLFSSLVIDNYVFNKYSPVYLTDCWPGCSCSFLFTSHSQQIACEQLIERIAPFKKANPKGKWQDWVN